jgi:GxxExxY protein
MSSRASATSALSPSGSSPAFEGNFLPQSHGDTELDEINQLTESIIGCAIEVHRELGPGLLEAIYEEALCIELTDAGLKYQRQVPFPIQYKGRALGEYRLDLIVGDIVIVEIKSVERMLPLFEAQLLTYLRATGKKVGLLMNFNSRLLRDGIKRLAL